MRQRGVTRNTRRAAASHQPPSQQQASHAL